jgi:hypothetical protein
MPQKFMTAKFSSSSSSLYSATQLFMSVVLASADSGFVCVNSIVRPLFTLQPSTTRFALYLELLEAGVDGRHLTRVLGLLLDEEVSDLLDLHAKRAEEVHLVLRLACSIQTINRHDQPGAPIAATRDKNARMLSLSSLAEGLILILMSLSPCSFSSFLICAQSLMIFLSSL